MKAQYPFYCHYTNNTFPHFIASRPIFLHMHEVLITRKHPAAAVGQIRMHSLKSPRRWRVLSCRVYVLFFKVYSTISIVIIVTVFAVTAATILGNSKRKKIRKFKQVSQRATSITAEKSSILSRCHADLMARKWKCIPFVLVRRKKMSFGDFSKKLLVQWVRVTNKGCELMFSNQDAWMFSKGQKMS